MGSSGIIVSDYFTENMKNVNCGRPSAYLDHKKPQQGRYESAALTRLHATKMLAVKSAVVA